MINVLLEDHQHLLLLLIKHNVQFMLVGGYAVIFHGYERTTGDMDIWLQLGNQNRDKLLKALNEFGIEEEDLLMLSKVDFSKPQQAIHIYDHPRSIDFLTLINNVKFEEAIKNVTNFLLDNSLIPFINYYDLIRTKITSSRLKDKADVEELQRINKLRNKG